MTYKITLDNNGAHCGDMSAKSNKGSICKLARDMIANGANPETTTVIYRGKTLCFQPVPLGKWAGLTVSETDHGRLKLTKWVPMPSMAFEAKP